MIMQEYPDVFQGIGKFQGPDYHIQLDPSIPPQTNTLLTNPHTSERAVPARNKQDVTSRVLVPVHKATPWINSFVLVESRDKLGNLKLCICLDLTNLNKAIVREPYHFRTPEDIAHLLGRSLCDDSL